MSAFNPPGVRSVEGPGEMSVGEEDQESNLVPREAMDQSDLPERQGLPLDDGP